MLDIDYEQRLTEANMETRAEVKKCEIIQEIFNLMNAREYNGRRRENRHIDPSPKKRRMDSRRIYTRADPDDKSFDIMNYLSTTSDKHTDLEREEVEPWIRSVLSVYRCLYRWHVHPSICSTDG